MKLAEIRELLYYLGEVQESEWTMGGTIRFETEIDGEKIIIDRRSNADSESSECYLKVGSFEAIYNNETEEFEMLSNFVMSLEP